MFTGVFLNRSKSWLSKAISIVLLTSAASAFIAPTAFAASFPCVTGTYQVTSGVASSGGSCTGSLTLDNTVTSIGYQAFYWATGLTSVAIPNSVTSIGIQAFQHTTLLTSVTIGTSVTSIGDSAFSTSGLTSITIPSGVLTIGIGAFQSSASLSTITIASSVTSIGDNAFFGTAATTFTYCGNANLSATGLQTLTNLCVTAPGAPTIGTAIATGATTATVSFTAPGSNGGSTILSYKATSNPGSITATLTQAGSGTISITGLSASTSYTFTVIAHNSVGDSSASSASNSITTQSGSVTLSAPTATTSSVTTSSFIVSFSMPTGATSVTLRAYESDGVTFFGSPITNFSSGSAVTGLTQGLIYKYSLTAIGNGSTYLTSSSGGLNSVSVLSPPMPSYFKMVSAPKISQNSEFIICTSATLIFMPWSTTPDQTKIRSQIISIRSGDLVLAQSDSLASTVKFSKSLFKPGLTLSCFQFAQQENAVAEVSSLDSAEVVVLKIEDKAAQALVKSIYKGAKADLAALRKITLSNLLGKKSIASKAGGFSSKALQDARAEYAVALDAFETNFEKKSQLLLRQKTAALRVVSAHIEADEEAAGICLMIS